MANKIRVFFPIVGELIKIEHIFMDEWKTIGKIKEVDLNLNIAKVKFIAADNKTKLGSFNLASGKIVKVSKKAPYNVENITDRDEGGYKLSKEMIYPYERTLYIEKF